LRIVWLEAFFPNAVKDLDMSQKSTFAQAGEAMLLAHEGERAIAQALFTWISGVISRLFHKPGRVASFR
jgi:hypothetical protein